jgi:hypothetical protein
LFPSPVPSKSSSSSNTTNHQFRGIVTDSIIDDDFFVMSQSGYNNNDSVDLDNENYKDGDGKHQSSIHQNFLIASADSLLHSLPKLGMLFDTSQHGEKQQPQQQPQPTPFSSSTVTAATTTSTKRSITGGSGPYESSVNDDDSVLRLLQRLQQSQHTFQSTIQRCIRSITFIVLLTNKSLLIRMIATTTIIIMMMVIELVKF